MATTFLVTKNRAVSTLATGINDAVTSLDVAAGEGTKFPSTYPFHITIDDEIMSCTNRSTDTLTVVRAEQGTVAAAHSSGAAVSLNITAKNVSDLNTAVNAIENQVAYGRLDGWTLNKLLKGAGAGSNPTEIDDPTYTAPTRSFFAQIFKSGFNLVAYYDNWATAQLSAAGQKAYGNCVVPADFSSLTGAYAVGIMRGTNTPTFDWTVTTRFAADGEAQDAHTDSVTEDGHVPVHLEMEALDITAAFTGLAAGDHIGIGFAFDAESGTDVAFYLIYILFTYSE